MQEWWHNLTVVNAAGLAPRARVFLAAIQIWPNSKSLQLSQSPSDDELARRMTGCQYLSNGKNDLEHDQVSISSLFSQER